MNNEQKESPTFEGIQELVIEFIKKLKEYDVTCCVLYTVKENGSSVQTSYDKLTLLGMLKFAETLQVYSIMNQNQMDINIQSLENNPALVKRLYKSLFPDQN